MSGAASADALHIRRSSIPFLWVGTIAIVVGGLVAAVTSPLNLEHGSWASAYLVLIVGVALIVFGVAQSMLTDRVAGRTITVEIAAWVLGSLAVLGGTLIETPLAVDAGGLILVVALVVFALTARARGAERARWPLWTFRIVLVIVLVSIPTGLLLSHVRHG